MSIRQGDGSQGNPYVVDSWDSLVQCCKQSGKYTQFPLEPVRTQDTVIQRGKLYYDSNNNLITNPKQADINTYYENSFELDLNDEYPEGIPIIQDGAGVWCGLAIEGEFDGRGGTIRNIYMSVGSYGNGLISFRGTSSWYSVLQNVDILNIYFVGQAVNNALIYASTSYDCIMRRCRVSGVLYSANFYHQLGSSGVKLQRCTFSMFGNIPDCSIFKSSGQNLPANFFTNSVFDFTCPRLRSICVDTELTVSATNCLFTGTYGFTYGASVYGTLNGCVFDFTFPDSIFIQINTVNVPTVFNITKAPTITFAGSTANIIQATTSQMQDASWLLSHGFPVGRLT